MVSNEDKLEDAPRHNVIVHIPFRNIQRYE